MSGVNSYNPVITVFHFSLNVILSLKIIAMKKEILTDIVVALFILLFSYTALSKFLDYNRFVFQMQLAPVPLIKSIAPVMGLVIPAIETIIVLFLMLSIYKPRFTVKALLSCIILMLVFEFYISAMLLSGLHLPCTCGGIISKMTWMQHLIFNACFIILGIVAIIQTKYRPVVHSMPVKS